MKNKKVLMLAAVAAIALGGFTLGGVMTGSTATAQSYGTADEAPDDQEVPEAESSAASEAPGQGTIVLVQDTDEPESEGDSADPEADDPERADPEGFGRRGHRGRCHLEDAAAVIGIDEEELRTAIESGDTIADVAEANGIDIDTLVEALVDAEAERLATKVEEGRITREGADEKLADAEARITDRVNGVPRAPRN